MVIVQFTPTVKLVYTNILYMKEVLSNYLQDIYGKDVFKESLKRRHASVPEFIYFVFRIKCSRVLSHQIVRHRIASYIQKSQRYSIQNPEIIVPRSVYSEEFVNVVEKCFELYNKYISNYKISKELARYILPNCCATEILCLWNLRELLESIIPLRLCSKAQPEFIYISYRISSYLLLYFPELSEYKLLGCRAIMYNKCPEKGLEGEKIFDCLRSGIIKALKEHGTDEEHKRAETLAELFIKKIKNEV